MVGWTLRNDEISADPTISEVEKRLRGKRSKMVGTFFEQMVEASCEYYKERGLAVIEKTPEPVKVLSGLDKKGQFKACFRKKAQPDYKGVLCGGQMIAFEAKHTDSERITYHATTEAQNEALEAYHNMGAECFVLVSFSFCDFYKIPWTEWSDMPMIYGRKYIKQCELEQFRIEENGNILHFLYEPKE